MHTVLLKHFRLTLKHAGRKARRSQFGDIRDGQECHRVFKIKNTRTRKSMSIDLWWSEMAYQGLRPKKLYKMLSTWLRDAESGASEDYHAFRQWTHQYRCREVLLDWYRCRRLSKDITRVVGDIHEQKSLREYITAKYNYY